MSRDELRTHQLKTWPASFAAIITGDKRAEYRKDDRIFQKGDLLVLNEYDPVPHKYTERTCVAVITDVQRGPDWGIPLGYVVMTIQVIPGMRTGQLVPSA